jgi:hypothetical protein
LLKDFNGLAENTSGTYMIGTKLGGVINYVGSSQDLKTSLKEHYEYKNLGNVITERNRDSLLVQFIMEDPTPYSN